MTRGEMRGPNVCSIDEANVERLRSRLAVEPDDAVCYFARRGRFIKIGCTRNPRARFSALRAYRDPDGNVGDIEVLLTIPGGRVTEACLHHLFRDYRVEDGGEFFSAELADPADVWLYRIATQTYSVFRDFERRRVFRLAADLI